jgi:hypothetical protein
VVLGKDVLEIFNAVLKPKEEYMDLVLVTFDWISTTTLCRTGELAPDLSQPGALDVIVTLDKLRIGNSWFKDIPMEKRKPALVSFQEDHAKGAYKHFSFWLTKHKAHSTEKQAIIITCTSGTDKHNILSYLLNMLYIRALHGDTLHDSAPLFAIPLQNKSLKTDFLPLSYADICAADKIRTMALGNLNIPFRSHLRRKGGASDLYDAGVPIKDIKVIGH